MKHRTTSFTVKFIALHAALTRAFRSASSAGSAGFIIRVLSFGSTRGSGAGAAAPAPMGEGAGAAASDCACAAETMPQDRTRAQAAARAIANFIITAAADGRRCVCYLYPFPFGCSACLSPPPPLVGLSQASAWAGVRQAEAGRAPTRRGHDQCLRGRSAVNSVSRCCFQDRHRKSSITYCPRQAPIARLCLDRTVLSNLTTSPA